MIITYLQFAVLLLDIALLLLIFFGSRRQGHTTQFTKTHNYFLIFTTITIFWLAIQASYDLADTEQQSGVLVRLANALTIILAGGFALFARSFKPYSYGATTYLSWGVPAGIIAIWSLINTDYYEVILSDAGTYTHELEVIPYSVITLPAILLIVAGVKELADVARNADDERQVKQARLIKNGMFITALIVLIGNYFFALVGLDSLASLTVLAATSIYIFVIAYAVFSLKLFDFRRFFYRVVVSITVLGVTFGLIIGVLAVNVAPYVHDLIADPEVSDLSVAILLALFGLLSLATYKIVDVIVGRLFHRINERYTFNYDRVFAQIQPYLRSIDMAELSNGVIEVIRRTLRVESVAVVLEMPETNQQAIYSTGSKPSSSDIQRIRTVMNNETTLDMIDKAEHLQDYPNYFVMNNREFSGALLVGHKLNGRVVYASELNVLRNITSDITLALQNAIQYEKIIRFNKELEDKITAATAELRTSNEKLKALDEAKDEFISMASHQLRTPLTSVKGYLSMVLEGDVGKLKPEQSKLLKEAFSSSQRMVYLISDLLNVSRLKTGKFVIERSEVDLGRIIDEEIKQLEPIAESRKVKIKYHKPRSFPRVWLDETKIRQVCMNFIDNAIYYTKTGGKIEVALTADKNKIVYRVKDNGIGVPKSEQAKLFTKFFRANNARKARPDGTGLGLYMAQRVVSAQGGSVIFESEEGKGSTFGFEFPLENVKKSTPEARPESAVTPAEPSE